MEQRRFIVASLKSNTALHFDPPAYEYPEWVLPADATRYTLEDAVSHALGYSKRGFEVTVREALDVPSEIVRQVMATAVRIPLGGSVSIKGDYPISGYNLADRIVAVVTAAAEGRDFYPMLCNQPATV